MEENTTPVSNDIVTGLIRQILTGLGSIAITFGYIDQDKAVAIIGGLTLVGSGIWMLVSKFRQQRKEEETKRDAQQKLETEKMKTLVALDMPKGSTPQDLDKKVESQKLVEVKDKV